MKNTTNIWCLKCFLHFCSWLSIWRKLCNYNKESIFNIFHISIEVGFEMCMVRYWLLWLKDCFMFFCFLLPLTHGVMGLKELNLVRCGTLNMSRLSDDILPRRGWSTFISIIRYKMYISRSSVHLSSCIVPT